MVRVTVRAFAILLSLLLLFSTHISGNPDAWGRGRPKELERSSYWSSCRSTQCLRRYFRLMSNVPRNEAPAEVEVPRESSKRADGSMLAAPPGNSFYSGGCRSPTCRLLLSKYFDMMSRVQSRS